MAVVTHLYDSYDDARRAMGELITAGVPQADISIVANNSNNRFTTAENGTYDTVAGEAHSGAGTGTGVGATVGGIAGLLAGLGIMAIPGVGPVVAAGWLASTALGAVVGGAAGGIIGALTDAGVPEEHAHVYAEGLRRGGTLLTARVSDADRARIETMLGTSSVDVNARREQYRSTGWDKFEEKVAADQATSRDKMPLI
jgi:hypothetical protein